MRYQGNKTNQVGLLSLSRSNLYYQAKQPQKDEKVKIMIEEALRKHPAYGHK
ncbi:MAG TPA: hypothetical protein PKL09_01395 [bacterium]|jgi:hypothetical protein|nr:hypothetical protein [bacterium]HNS33789.1 hypothetical protein [bacterium]